jgi:hypothetical protein
MARFRNYLGMFGSGPTEKTSKKSIDLVLKGLIKD